MRTFVLLEVYWLHMEKSRQTYDILKIILRYYLQLFNHKKRDAYRAPPMDFRNLH